MKVRTQVVLVLAMIAALLATTTAAGAQDRDDSAPETGAELTAEEARVELADFEPLTDQDVEQMIEAELGYWMGLRKSLHFPHDQDTVKKIARSKEARAILEEAGFPLTAEEQKEMEIRSAIGAESSDLHESGIAKEKWYGGGYLDHEKGHVVIAVKGAIPRNAKADLLRVFSHPDRVSFSPVQHSYQELEAAFSAIERDAGRIDGWSSLGIDVIQNAVLLGVDDPSIDRQPNEAVNALVAEAARGVKVIVEYEASSAPAACVSRTNCPTTATEEFRGGLGLFKSGLSHCTTGFMARAKDNPSIRLIVTAGHCDKNPAQRDRTVGGQSSGAFAFTGANTIWDYSTGTWTTQNQDVDAAAFQVSNARYGNRIYKSDQFKSWFINDTDNWNNQNELVCASGRTIGYRCGLVAVSSQSSPGGTSASSIAAGGGMTLTRQMKFNITRVGWNLPVVQGSSGGPVTGSPSYNYTKRDALGILVRATANSQTMEDGIQVTKNLLVVSRVDFIEDDLNVWIQTSAP